MKFPKNRIEKIETITSLEELGGFEAEAARSNPLNDNEKKRAALKRVELEWAAKNKRWA